MRLEPSKLVEPPPGSGRKRQLREHVLRQSAAIAANGGNHNVFKRQNSMQGLETIGIDQYHDVLVNTLYEVSKTLFEEHVTSTLQRKKDEYIHHRETIKMVQRTGDSPKPPPRKANTVDD